MSGFAGRIVLVTGAAMGIGLAAAHAFLRDGATVYLADRDEAALAAARAALEGSHHAIVFDVTDEDGWSDAAARVERQAGTLDVLVNNAGYGAFRSIAESTLDEWRQVMAVNLDSVFLGTRAMLPLLARSGNGAIVNVSSIRGVIGGVNSGAYCASKGGVRLFTKATALECAALGNGVRANSLHPGLIDTPLARAVFDDPVATARRVADIPLARAGTAEEAAAAILYLAGDASRYMTGAELLLDGGQSAG